MLDASDPYVREFYQLTHQLLKGVATMQTQITPSLTLKLQQQYNLEAGRVYRAVQIVNQCEIRHLANGHYLATAHSIARTEYVVDLSKLECGCTDRVKGEFICKHLIAGLILKEVSPKFQNVQQALDFYTQPFQLQLT